MPLISPLEILRASVLARPEIVGYSTQTSTSSPITITLPRRENGILLFCLIGRHAGGVAAPGTPSGWTSLASSSAAPAHRLAYRICDGTDALTTTSSSLSATSMSAICIAVRNWNKIFTPVGSISGASTNTTPAPPSQAFTAFGNFLWLAGALWDGNATLTTVPPKYTESIVTVTQSTNGGQAFVGRHYPISPEAPGTFTISASVANRGITLGVAG